MLMHNASSHLGWDTEELHGFTVMRLSHVLIVFLPANTTSRMQPLDQGIITAFEMRCAICFCTRCVECVRACLYHQALQS